MSPGSGFVADRIWYNTEEGEGWKGRGVAKKNYERPFCEYVSICACRCVAGLSGFVADRIWYIIQKKGKDGKEGGWRKKTMNNTVG